MLAVWWCSVLAAWGAAGVLLELGGIGIIRYLISLFPAFVVAVFGSTSGREVACLAAWLTPRQQPCAGSLTAGWVARAEGGARQQEHELLQSCSHAHTRALAHARSLLKMFM